MLEGGYGEVAGGGAEITHAELLLALAAEFGPVNDERARWRMDELGRRRRGHPALLAVVYSSLMRHGARWYLGLDSPSGAVLVAPLAGPATPDSGSPAGRTVCPHELAHQLLA